MSSKTCYPWKVWIMGIHISIGSIIQAYSLLEMNSITDNIGVSLGWKGSYWKVPVMTSLYPAGSIIGAIRGAPLSKQYGKRTCLIYCNLFYILFSLVTIIPTNPTFALGRFGAGIFGGIFNTICPGFINEMTPDSMTGQVGTLIQQGSNLGYLLSFLFGLLMPYENLETNPMNNLWIPFILFPCILSLYQIYFFMVFFKHESPAWLLRTNRVQEAEAALAFTHTPEGIPSGISRIVYNPRLSLLTPLLESLTTKLFCHHQCKRMLRYAIILNIGREASGALIMRIYSMKIFAEITDNKFEARLYIFIIGVITLAVSLFTIILLKFIGRKTLLVFGQACIVLNFAILGTLIQFFDVDDRYKAAMVILFFVFLSISLGPTFWTYIGEVCNDKYVSVGYTFHLITVMILSITFPFMQRGLGIGGCFYLLSFMASLLLIYEIFDLFETKGLTKQDIKNRLID